MSIIRHSTQIPSTPIVAKRKILGSMKERTVFIPMSQYHSQPPFLQMNENQTPQTNAVLQELGERISKRIEQIIQTNECELDNRLAEINEQMQHNAELQRRLQAHVAELKIKLNVKTKHLPNVNPVCSAPYRRSIFDL